jgi:hypothetical protein
LTHFWWGRFTEILRWQTDLNFKICPLSFGTSTSTNGRGNFDLLEIILVTLVGARP